MAISLDPQIRTDSSDFQVQFLIDKGYTIGSKMAEGPNGVLYKATQKDDEVVIKIFQVDWDIPDEFVNQEIEKLSSLDHPDLVTYRDIVKAGSKIYLFMDFEPQGTLADYVDEFGILPEWGAKLLISPVVDSLEYLHNAGIPHRNIKLGNIFFDDTLNPKLSDYGIRHLYLLDEAKGFYKIGHKFYDVDAYMPPEFLQNHPVDPMKADIWSLGICLYVMLNATFPFDKRNPAKMTEMQLRKEWSFSRSYKASDEVQELIRRCLEPNPDLRITLADIKAHPWMPSTRRKSHLRGDI